MPDETPDSQPSAPAGQGDVGKEKKSVPNQSVQATEPRAQNKGVDSSAVDDKSFKPGGLGIRMAGNFLVQLKGTDLKEIAFDIAGKATDEEAQLRSEIESSITTLNGMFPNAGTDARETVAFNQYLEKLFWIAKAGLQYPGEPKLATFALRSFQNDVLWREGGRLKNSYMKALGYWAVVFAGTALLLYLGIAVARVVTPLGNAMEKYDSFLILWIGAMIGCWLSFGIRNVRLTFADLGRPEGDLLQPNVRLVFTGVLAVTLGLIFSVGMVQVEVGGLKTSELSDAIKALVIGLFCGISEQSLSSTVGGRAQQFMGQISK